MNGVIREMSMVSTLIYFIKVVATLSLELIESTYFPAVSLGRQLRFWVSRCSSSLYRHFIIAKLTWRCLARVVNRIVFADWLR